MRGVIDFEVRSDFCEICDLVGDVDKFSIETWDHRLLRDDAQ